MKTRATQTDFALLGLLHLGPRSGYDLKRLADESIHHFWREGWGRIYPALRRLEAEGMVGCRTERRKGKGRGARERHVYTLRPAGQKMLRAWLAKEWTPEVERNELLLKLFFSRAGAPGQAVKHVERCGERAATAVATYRAVLKAIEESAAGKHPDAPFWKMTLRYGIRLREAQQRWATETLEELRGLA